MVVIISMGYHEIEWNQKINLGGHLEENSEALRYKT
jgi:hypothetical protein